MIVYYWDNSLLRAESAKKSRAFHKLDTVALDKALDELLSARVILVPDAYN
jgi:hypothetical protein